jgi:hypothetical protein
LDLIRLKAALGSGRIQWERHVLERLFERNISRDNVINVLRAGDCIEDYPDDRAFPSALFLGWVEGTALHVVAALDAASPRLYIITAYEPDLGHFEPDFRTRRNR